MPDDCRQSQRRRIHSRSKRGTVSGLFRIYGSDGCLFYDNILAGVFLTRKGWSGFTFTTGLAFRGDPVYFVSRSHGPVHEKPEPGQPADLGREDSGLEGAVISPEGGNSEERGQPVDRRQWTPKTMISRKAGDPAQIPGSLKDGSRSQGGMASRGCETPPRHRLWRQ